MQQVPQLNHFVIKRLSQAQKSVKTIDDGNEIFQTQISAVNIDDAQLATVKLSNGNFLRFQADTGAQCNVLPSELYKKATKDHELIHVTPVQKKITAYGGTEIPVVGRALLKVQRGDVKCRLDCKLVDKDCIRPLLGRKACLGMKIVQSNLDYPNPRLSELYTRRK